MWERNLFSAKTKHSSLTKFDLFLFESFISFVFRNNSTTRHNCETTKMKSNLVSYLDVWVLPTKTNLVKFGSCLSSVLLILRDRRKLDGSKSKHSLSFIPLRNVVSRSIQQCWIAVNCPVPTSTMLRINIKKMKKKRKWKKKRKAFVW